MTDHGVLQVCKALPPLRRDKAQQLLDLRIGKGALQTNGNKLYLHRRVPPPIFIQYSAAVPSCQTAKDTFCAVFCTSQIFCRKKRNGPIGGV